MGREVYEVQCVRGRESNGKVWREKSRKTGKAETGKKGEIIERREKLKTEENGEAGGQRIKKSRQAGNAGSQKQGGEKKQLPLPRSREAHKRERGDRVEERRKKRELEKRKVEKKTGKGRAKLRLPKCRKSWKRRKTERQGAAEFEKLTSRKSGRAEERGKQRSYCCLEGGNQKMGNRKTETKSDRGAGRWGSKTKKQNQEKGRRNYDYLKVTGWRACRLRGCGVVAYVIRERGARLVVGVHKGAGAHGGNKRACVREITK